MTKAPDMPEDDALAAEYALRLLDDEGARAFEARMARDPALAARVRAWEAMLAEMAEDLPPVPPPARVRARLMAGLSGAAAPRRMVPRWRWAWAGGMAAAALALLLVVAPTGRGPVFDPVQGATLLSADGALRIEAGLAPDGNRLRVVRAEGGPRPGRALELWLIAAGAEAPLSLGVLPERRETILVLDGAMAALVAGATLAVSDEPAGGSPTGQPTGDVLAAAALGEV